MGKDLINDRYGRFRELPIELARMGHEVQGVCFSYRARVPGEFRDLSGEASVQWTSINLGKGVLPGIARHRRSIRRIADEFQPEVVIAASDAFHAVVGVSLARSSGTRVLVDLYDNFESYRGSSLPLVAPAFRRAVRQADIVTCISDSLADLVRCKYQRSGPTITLENGIRSDLFFPGDRGEARNRLGLPPGVPVIALTGALLRQRDIEVAFRGVDLVAERIPDLLLVVAGPRDKGLKWPQVARVVDLGLRKHEEIPDIMRASNALIVPNRDSKFGRYSFPQKAVESIATGTPIVAAATPEMKLLLVDDVASLYRIGDPHDLARALLHSLRAPVTNQVTVMTWSDLATKLAAAVAA